MSEDKGPFSPHESGDQIRQALSSGEIEILGRFRTSSNATFLVSCTLGDLEVKGVFKPERGERRLGDFPIGLWKREIAAFELSELFGWDLVPLTIQRSETELGVGSMQLFVPEDGVSHYFTLVSEQRWHDTLKKIAVFDMIANNADRKSGHVLFADTRLWAIDHGLTFHHHFKLRTVIWDFAKSPIQSESLEVLEKISEDDIDQSLGEHLEPKELEAVFFRIKEVLGNPLLPDPTDRGGWPPYPWPLV